MPEIGQNLAHYSIVEKIGKGGMGEVFRAKDQKLGREVAIKVLPEEFAKDADRVARFQREAKLLASLNHPNIAAIHGLEESGGIQFLVLELVEGETLAERIVGAAAVGPVRRTGPTMTVEETGEILKISLQIAEALEAAHEKGVIHRDLKPANIKVTPEGKVKVLDFGLAKAFAGEQADLNLSNSPTLSNAATQQGVILGTAAYMSPEQARGKTVDKRADIWAFGCVLFEMLAGRAAFSGKDVTDILAAVIRSEPEWNSLHANLHWRLREVLERCLKKDARDRYRDIYDVKVDIQKVLADPSGVLVQPVAAMEPQTKMRTIIPWIAAAVVVAAIIAGVAVWKLKPPEPRRVMRFTNELPEGQQLNVPSNLGIQLAVSPDGSRFVYGTTDGLQLRSVNELDARLIAGTDKGSIEPFFSPDGQWIGYWSQSEQKLKKVAISGGAPVFICDTGPLVLGASWNSDNTIVYSDMLQGIMRISTDGGTAEVLIKGSMLNAAKEGFPTGPQMLPDGKTLLFTNYTGSNQSNWQIGVQSLKSGERKILIRSGLGAIYCSTGHLVYGLVNNNTASLLAVPIDLDRLAVKGGAVPIIEGIGAAAISDSGTLVYVPQPAVAAGAASTALSANTLVWVDRQGKEEPLGAAPDDYRGLKISPDGTKVALTIAAAGNQDIWIWDIPHKTPTKLTFDKTNDNNPLWTPDGNRIVFWSGRSGESGGVYWKSAAGIGEEELLASRPDRAIYPWSFSRDGKILALTELTISPLGIDIGMLSMEGKRDMKELLQEKHSEGEPQISPDGRYVAYQSDESGKGEIYVRSFPDVNKGKWQVSSNGGGSPLWSPDGSELFYRSGDATMAVDVETDPTFKRGNPKTLFRGTYSSTAIQNSVTTPWDISPDGKKFLMIKPPASAAAPTAASPRPKIIVVVNWFEELKQRVPVK
jgi:serine/threonine protein kinase/Tol biopolymer transport system component